MLDVLPVLHKVNILRDLNAKDMSYNHYILGSIKYEETASLTPAFFQPTCLTRKRSEKNFPLHKSVWHTLNDDSIEIMDMYIFSAIYDDREAGGAAPFVRILAVGTNVKTLYCHIWYTSILHPFTTIANIKSNGRGHTVEGQYFAQYFFSCPLPATGNDIIPSHVTVATNQCGEVTNMIPVSVPVKENTTNVGICVPVTFWHVDPYRIIEWVEMNKLFGVQEINVYTCNVSDITMKIFKYFQSTGIHKIHNMPPILEGHSYDGVKVGSPASINDCFWRNMYRYKYTLIIDFDEIIVPKKTLTYTSLLNSIDIKYQIKEPYKSYSFQNTYFWVGCPEFSNKSDNGTYMFQYTHREKPSQIGHSTKSFLDPRRCLSAFNHWCLIEFDSQKRIQPSK